MRRLLPIFLFLISLNSWARITFEDGAYPELATSARGLAMGNAYICKVDDASSVYYNPAGLGTVRFPHLHLSNLHLETNRGWLAMGGGGPISAASSNFTKGFSLDGTRQLLLENKGKLSHSRFHFLPNFTARYISMGYLYSKQSRSTISTEPGALFEYADRTDHGPFLGLNISLFGGVLKFGASGTYLLRSEAIGEADPNTTIKLQSTDYAKGSMMLVTTGFKLTMPVAPLPIIAIKMNNATSQDFSKSGDTKPEKIKQSVDVGFSITPQIGKGVRLHLEGNFKDATFAHDELSTARRWGAGMELDVARTFFFRLGYGDGFGSLGLGVKSKKLEFDLTTYAVDTTSSQYRGKEDRRFVLSLSSGF